MVRSLILNPLQCRIGMTAPDSRGSRYLMACHALEVECQYQVCEPERLGRSRCRGSRLGFTISNDASHDEIGVIHDGAERHGQRIPQFSAFVNGAGSLGIDVAANY
jgi:hypothetical protein